jgi:DNA-binding beta-propeller fold protein YncE
MSSGRSRMGSKGVIRIAVVAAAVIAAGVAWATPIGVIGPKSGIQPTGRTLDPIGKLTQLGNFPTGGALTAHGRFLWTLSTGRGPNDVRIVRVAPEHGQGNAGVGDVVQTIPMPGLTGGIAMAPDGRTAYVSGVRDSAHLDQQTPPSVPGRGGDVIHVFRYDAETGVAQRDGVIPVPPPPGTLPYQTFPPGSTAVESWPRDLAVSPDGRTLLASLNLADSAAIIDTSTRQTRYVRVGHYPYGAAITNDGRFGLVTSETEGTVSVIDLTAGSVVKNIQVGPHLSHPEGMAVDPTSPRAFVANANQDTIAVIDTDEMTVERTLSVARPEGTGTSPTYLSVTPDGCDLLSADSGEDAVAVFALSDANRCEGKGSGPQRQPFELIGRLPVGSYPTMAAASSAGQLAWISARGLGVGPNPNGPNPFSPNDSDDFINSFQYLPSIVRGASGILDFPSDRAIRKLTPRADRQIVPSNSQSPPPGTPIRPNGPIKHVFYIVRENRTYDQILGDDPRGDGDPNLTLFGEHFTPNVHALVRRFPLLDHVYANSEASIDGHYWTAAGAVSDYVTKNWPQNYAARGRPYDFGAYEVSKPPKDYLFHRALPQHDDVSFYNYGEALAGVSPLPDKDRTAEATAENLQILDISHTDGQIFGGCYDSDIAIFDRFGTSEDVYDSSLPPGAAPGSHSRFDCFRSRFTSQLASQSVPAFSYIVLPLDHTQGVSPGARTPDADVASNDWALGQIVDLISHSSIWNRSLILVVEDDSQDGADHVDAHRIPALAISPYTQRGAVVHNRYDQLSFLRTLEIIVGLKPLHLAEALAVPLYDAMTPSPQNGAPYDAIVPDVEMSATNPNTAANRRASAGLPLNVADEIPQRTLDAILWRYRHGPGAKPPPPGPNASGQDGASEEAEEEAGEGPLGDPRELVRRLRDSISDDR